MKHLLTAVVASAALAGSVFSAQAQEEKQTIRYDLQLDTPLTIPQTRDRVDMVFIAPETGTLTVSTTISDGFAVYSPYVEGKEYSMDPEVDPLYPVNYLSYWPWKISMEVEEGKSYLFLSRGGFFSDQTVTATMGGLQAEILSITPTPDSALPITGSVMVEVNFNTNTVNADKCIVTSGTQEAEIVVNNYNGSFFVEHGSTIYQWLVEDETIQPGDPIKFTFSGITVDGKTVSSLNYGDVEVIKDGTMVLNYVAPQKPVVFEGCSKADNSIFYSYYAPGDEEGIFTYTFSGPVTIDKDKVVWTYGSAEIAGNGFAMGTLPFSIEGNKVHVNATGVLRNMAVLAPDAPANMPIYVNLQRVRDAQGNYIYTEGQGTVGTVTSEFNYQPLPRIDVLADFDPVSGSNIDGVKQITISVNPIDKIEFSGVNFSYTEDGKTYNSRASYTVDEAAADDGFVPIYAAVPDDVIGKGEITVTLADLIAYDGVDHAQDVKAVYTSTASVFSVSADNRNADGVCPMLQAFTVRYKDGLKLAPAQTPANITLYNKDREIIAEIAATAENVKVEGGKATFQFEKPVEEDGMYVLIIPEGTFLLGSAETPNEPYDKSFTVEVPKFGIVDGIKVSPNPDRVQPALTTIVMEWMNEKAVSFVADAQGSGVFDAEGNMVSPVDFSFDAARKNVLNVYVTTPVRTKGVYTVKFVAGQFDYNEDGFADPIYSLPIEFSYTIEPVEQEEKPWDKVTYDPNPAEELESLSKFYITWPDCEAAGVANDFSDVKLDVRNAGGSVATMVSFDIDWAYPANTIMATLDQEITTPGEYTVIFPAGYFTFNDNTDNVSKEFEVTYTIKTPGGDEEYKFVPNPKETQKELGKFFIYFNEHTSVGPKLYDKLPVLNAQGEKVAEAEAGFDMDDYETLNKILVTIVPELKTNGSYTITFPAGQFDYDDGNSESEQFSVTYVISDGSGVALVITDNDDVKVYDLEGRMVRDGKGAATLRGLRGAYVVNGVKVILK